MTRLVVEGSRRQRRWAFLVALDGGSRIGGAPVVRFVCGLTRRDLCTRSGAGRDRPVERGAMAGETIGRREELLAFDEFLRAVPAGGQALLLEGDAGIGKTALWQEGSRLARERGFRALTSRSADSETQIASLSTAGQQQ